MNHLKNKNRLDDLLSKIDSATTEEVQNLIKAGKKHLKDLCLTASEKNYCTKIIKSLYMHHGKRCASIVDQKTKKSRKEFVQSGNYYEICKNIIILNAFKEEHPGLDMKYFAYLMKGCDDYVQHIKETFPSQVFSRYMKPGNGMQILDKKGKAYDHLNEDHGKKHPLELIHGDKADHPK
ncbi:MAG: hypothetical protein KKE23_01930 [Nanoarchaeota archaeon]|nr:hypothetical protein [Nanoarchaeota archaeon]